MGSVAGRRTWTLEDLTELFGRIPVAACDASARRVPLPEPVRARLSTDHSRDAGWTAFLETVYPVDRVEVGRAWRECIQWPGRPVRGRYRERRAFVWWECEMLYLNLLDQPEFGVVMCGKVDIGAVEAPVDRGSSDAEGASASAPVWQLQHLNELGEVIRCEGFSFEMLGVEPADMVGRDNLSTIHPEDQALAVSMWLDLLGDPGGTRTVTLRICHPQDGYRWYESMMTNRLHEPAVKAVVVISYDIEDRRRKESAIRASERQFRTLAEEIPVGVFRADAEGRITYANDRFRTTIGEIDHLHGLPWEVAAWWVSVLDGDQSEEVVFELGRRTLRLRGRAQRSDVESPDGAVVEAVIGSVEDITSSVVRERHLHELAHSDPLTGLANRRVLEQVTEAALLGPDPIVVIVADLDGFKALNDDAGHHIGDAVLVEVARRLTAVVRPDDLVTRIGGDEFVVVCRSVSDEARDDLVERIRSAISQPIAAAGGVSLGVSVGSARAGADDDMHAVLRRADHEMYEDKRRRHHRR